jgi:hypothetical protein
MPHSIELIASTRKKTKETVRVQDLLPEDLREKSANLIQLLRDYYTHINESGQASYEINSINSSRDIDTADSIFLDKIQKEIAAAIPKNIVANRVNLYKNLIRYYSVRGSQDSIELFFRVLFNDSVEVYYPREDMLIPSSGVWNAGAVRPVYTTAPNVIIHGNGTGATAHTTVANGAVQSVEIVDGGSGYDTATLEVNGDGTGATAEAIISRGEILRIVPFYYTTAGEVVYTRGDGYAPNSELQVQISGGTGFSGTPAVASAFTNDLGEIDYVAITNAGTDYTSGSVTASIIAGSGFGGTPAELYVDVNSSGVITGVKITNSGKNYTSATITVTGDGSSANLVPHLADGVINTITAVDEGSGYTGTISVSIPGGTKDAVVFANRGTGANEGKIMSYTIAYGGGGYTLPGILIDTYQGIYTQNKGFVSDTIKLQDSYFYQKFSYVIRTGNNVDTWKDSFNKLVHPAGFIFFGEILILLEFLASRAKMPKVPPGYIDTTDLARLFIFEVLESLTSSVGGLDKTMSLIIPVGTSHTHLMRYYDDSPVNPYLSLTVQEADGFSEESPTDPLYPYGDYTIDDVINSVITFNDIRIGANLLT